MNIELDEFAERLRLAYYPDGARLSWSEIGNWLKERWRNVARKALEREVKGNVQP